MQDQQYGSKLVDFVAPDNSVPLFDPITFQINRRACHYPFTHVVKGKLKPLDVQENFDWLMKLLGIHMRYNKMTRRCDIAIPGRQFYHEEAVNLQIASIENILRINDMTPTNTGHYILNLACRAAYHPVLEAIVAKPWDDTPRWDDFIRVIKAKNNDIAYQLIRLWMMQCIEALLTDDGYVSHGVLILAGEPGTGKTYWFKNLSLVPKSIRTENTFNVHSKDERIELTSFWINEIAEIDGSFKRGEPVAALKSYFTSERDIIRCPYAKAASDFSRRTAFGGTTNQSEFLTDTTGNRRYWIVQVENIQWDHGIDMQQVWAEVYAHCIAGNKVKISPELLKTINVNNASFDEIDPLEESFMTKFDWSNNDRIERTATEIWGGLTRSNSPPTHNEKTRMGKILAKYVNNGKISKRMLKGVQLYAIPAFVFHNGIKVSSRW